MKLELKDKIYWGVFLLLSVLAIVGWVGGWQTPQGVPGPLLFPGLTESEVVHVEFSELLKLRKEPEGLWRVSSGDSYLLARQEKVRTFLSEFLKTQKGPVVTSSEEASARFFSSLTHELKLMDKEQKILAHLKLGSPTSDGLFLYGSVFPFQEILLIPRQPFRGLELNPLSWLDLAVFPKGMGERLVRIELLRSLTLGDQEYPPYLVYRGLHEQRPQWMRSEKPEPQYDVLVSRMENLKAERLGLESDPSSLEPFLKLMFQDGEVIELRLGESRQGLYPLSWGQKIFWVKAWALQQILLNTSESLSPPGS